MKYLPILLLVFSAPLAAQSLPDPTVPAWTAQPNAAPVGEGVPAVAPGGGEPQLQSVLLSKTKNGRRLAVIDGQTYKLGDTMKDMQIMQIDENRVVLRQGTTTKILKLYGAPAQAGKTEGR